MHTFIRELTYITLASVLILHTVHEVVWGPRTLCVNMRMLKALLIGAVGSVRIKLTCAQQVDLMTWTWNGLSMEEAAGQGVRGVNGEVVGNTVVDVVGNELLYAPHPQFQVALFQFVNGELGWAVKLDCLNSSRCIAGFSAITCARTGNRGC